MKRLFKIYSKKVNIPNTLSFLRILLSPFIIYFWFWHSQHLTALILLTLAITTDFTDGWIARRTNSITDFGKNLDSIADKALIVPLMLLAVKNYTPCSWQIIALVILEGLLILAAFLNWALKLGRKYGSNNFGKLKMVFESMTVLLIFSYQYLVPAIMDPNDFAKMIKKLIFVSIGCAFCSLIIHLLTKEEKSIPMAVKKVKEITAPTV